MIIDMHTYAGDSLLGESLPPEQLFAAMERHGIDASVVCPMKGLDPFYLEPNREIARLQRAHPGKAIGFARVNPHLGRQAVSVLEEAFDEMGLRGLVLHPWEETFAVNDPKVFPLVECALRRSLPVMLETGYPILSHPLQTADLARRYPEGTFIMTHGGQLDSSGWSMTDAEYVMRGHPNLIMETSGLFADELLERLPGELGPDRLVFGSHSPWLNLGLELKRLERAHMPEETKQRILGGTARKLLNIQEHAHASS